MEIKNEAWLCLHSVGDPNYFPKGNIIHVERDGDSGSIIRVLIGSNSECIVVDEEPEEIMKALDVPIHRIVKDV